MKVHEVRSKLRMSNHMSAQQSAEK